MKCITISARERERERVNFEVGVSVVETTAERERERERVNSEVGVSVVETTVGLGKGSSPKNGLH